MHQLSVLKPYAQLFYSRFKLAHHTGHDASVNPTLNFCNLFVTTIPKAAIATTLLNQWRALKNIAPLQMPGVAIPRLGLTVPYLLIGTTVIVLAAGFSGAKWANKRVSQGVNGIEALADLASAVAAVGLIAAGQTFAGGVVLAFLAVQVLERSHYISPNTSFAFSCLGYFAGAATATTLLERAVCVSLLALLSLGKYKIQKNDEFEQKSTNIVHANADHFISFLYLKSLVLGNHHPSRAWTMLSIGMAHFDHEEYGKGKKWVEQAQTLLIKCGSKPSEQDRFKKSVPQHLQRLAAVRTSDKEHTIQLYLRELDYATEDKTQLEIIEKLFTIDGVKTDQYRAPILWKKKLGLLNRLAHQGMAKAECHFHIGEWAFHFKAHNEAFEAYTELFKLQEDVPGVDYNAIFMKMAEVFKSDQSRFMESYLKLLGVYEKKRPDQYFKIGYGYGELAVFFEDKDYDNIIEYINKSLNYYSKLDAGSARNQSVMKRCLAKFYFRKNQSDEGVKCIEEAFSFHTKLPLKDQLPGFYEGLYQQIEKTDKEELKAKILLQIGHCYAEQKNWDKALENYSKSLPLYEKLKHADRGYVISKISFMHEQKGEYQKAIEQGEKAYTIFQQTNHFFNMAIMRLRMAVQSQKLSNHPQALTWVEEACNTYLKVEQKEQNKTIYSELKTIVTACNTDGVATLNKKQLIIEKIEQGMKSLI